MNELTYNEAINELEKILEELENNTEINFDQITQKVQRATELLEFCTKNFIKLMKIWKNYFPSLMNRSHNNYRSY